MIRMNVRVLLAVFAIGGVSCNGATPPIPTPGPTPSSPSQAWILQPNEGANLLVNQPRIIQLQGASFHGIDWFVIKASEAGMEWKVAPQSTGSGGAQYGTMFFTQTSWTPHVTGSFTIEARAINASGSSPWAAVHVNVINLSKATHTPTLLPGQPPGHGIKLTWTPSPTLVFGHAPPLKLTTLTPTQLIIYATAKMNANCRAGPGTAYNERGFVAKGDTVEVVGRNETRTWLDLVNPNGKGTCWASIVAFDIPFDMDSLPVAFAPTPPASSNQGGIEESKPKGCTVTNPLTGQISCVSPCPAGAAPGRECNP